MPDNWGFVAAAYGLAFVVFGGYWRWLAQREREVAALRGAHPRPEPGPRAPLQ
jgi:hypothetical protein